MAKILKIAAVIAVNVGAVFFPQLLPLAISLDAGLITQALTPPPALGGTQTGFKSDPKAPIPICVGRTFTGGNIVYTKTHGDKNEYLTLVTVLSLGPVESIDSTSADKEVVTFTGGNADGDFHDRMWIDLQLGLCPEPDELDTGIGTPPGWTDDSKLSGLSAVMLTIRYDGKGDTTLVQVPRMGWLGHWVKGYDPRFDSTYPGGSGDQRWNDETTWEWTQNPYIVGLTFAIGWHQNGVRVGGVGMIVDTIDVTGFVEGANVCDANSWKIGGSFTTSDDKWGVLKSILQAGGGEPIKEGATLSCIVNTPRVPIATISNHDIVGSGSIPANKTRRDRFNGVIPTYRSEDHDWEVVPAGEVRNSTYLAEDGTERTRQIDYSLVQCEAGDTPDQAAQLAGYDIANAREADNIVLPCKLKWIGYRPGDCLECDADETGLDGKQLIVQKRSLDPATGSVTLTLRTEDPDKHAWALGLVGVATPTTTKNGVPEFAAPDAGHWSLAAEMVIGEDLSLPGLRITGNTNDDPNVDTVLFDVRSYSPGAGVDDGWSSLGTADPGVSNKLVTDGIGANTSYEVSIRYQYSKIFLRGITPRLILGPVTTGSASTTSGRWATTTGGRWMTSTGGQWVLDN
jgi:hypothetical protein